MQILDVKYNTRVHMCVRSSCIRYKYMSYSLIFVSYSHITLNAHVIVIHVSACADGYSKR